MAQLKQATDKLRAQIDEVVASNRTDVVDGDRGTQDRARRERLLREGDDRRLRRARCGESIRRSRALRAENQIALIREIGASFEASVYPELLDQLAASQQGGRRRRSRHPPKQTVSVKTISVVGVSGVLETEEDVDRYLAALRNALVQTLNDGKRISL